MSKKTPRDPAPNVAHPPELSYVDSPETGVLEYHYTDGFVRRVQVGYEQPWDAQKIKNEVHCPDGMQLVHDEYEDVPVLDAYAEPDIVAEIKEWWLRTAQTDAQATVRKYQEYGSNSLSDLGYEMAELMGWGRPERKQAQELAVYYFLLGKMARLKTAILNREPASDDTWLDIACYAMIARKARESGAWPTGDKE